MATDFMVIAAGRQRFGGDSSLGSIVFEGETEQEAPFVGMSKNFPFSCPNVDPRQRALLQFESVGVQAGLRGTARNVLQINGINIPGGITPGSTQSITEGKIQFIWKAHSLIVPANVLKEENVLHIEAKDLPFGPSQTDDFILDNIVVLFKTRR